MKTKQMLNEAVVAQIETMNESLRTKVLPTEDVVKLFESAGDKIQTARIPLAVRMVQLQEKSLNETNVSANIEPFTKKLQPLLRRIIPNMIAFDIAGVQPVDGPSNSVFAIKSKYAGSKTTSISNTAKVLVYTVVTPVAVGNTITAASGATGVVKYVEEEGSVGKLIVDGITGSFVSGEKFDIGGTYAAGENDNTITAIYTSEASYKQILKHYSGPYTTAAGEVLGDDMNQLKVTVERLAVDVKTRALKAEFTMELVQDLQAMHGAAADEELLNFLETEINLDLDREIIENYKAIATVAPDFAVATQTDSQGRWNMEMYAGLFQKILKTSNGLAVKNRRGKGNILLATAGVISALESLGKFKMTAYEEGVKTGENQATTFVGTLTNGMKVYQDWFSVSEYAMVIYKGSTEMDAGLIYSPYAPLQVVEAVHAQTLQPVMGIKTRYGLTANTLLDDGGSAGSNYAEIFSVDFTNTPLY